MLLIFQNCAPAKGQALEQSRSSQAKDLIEIAIFIHIIRDWASVIGLALDQSKTLQGEDPIEIAQFIWPANMLTKTCMQVRTVEKKKYIAENFQIFLLAQGSELFEFKFCLGTSPIGLLNVTMLLLLLVRQK